MTVSPGDEVALLRVGEVANRANVSTKTVRRWIVANELTVVRFGRSVRIPQAELAHFIAARTSKK